jgi:hypothetical protein
LKHGSSTNGDAMAQQSGKLLLCSVLTPPLFFCLYDVDLTICEQVVNICYQRSLLWTGYESISNGYQVMPTSCVCVCVFAKNSWMA